MNELLNMSLGSGIFFAVLIYVVSNALIKILGVEK